ncbi:MAG TPA: hypothetical protein VMR25_24130 [Planctomycetaceae bacterium]|jgi:hypothetical protein|nr:hypothetical protein [Planctomycetaceae bacterium]
MADLRHLREIEKLVQDSVFSPSPRHHLRERVLQNAVQAKHRQKLWQRFVVATSSVTGTLVIALVVARLCTPGPKLATDAGPVRIQIDSPGQSARLPAAPARAAAPGSSLGEELYFHPARLQYAGSPHAARPATGLEQSNFSNSKDLATNPE